MIHQAASFFNQRCIRNRRISMDAARRQSKRVPDAKYIQDGDVLINSTGVGTLGRVAQVFGDTTNTTVDSHVTIVRPLKCINRDFFGIALVNMEPHFELQGFGATSQTELRRDRITNTGMTLPPTSVQEKFSRVVSPVRSLAQLLVAKNIPLSTTRDLLLPRLISGEIDLSNAEEIEVQ